MEQKYCKSSQAPQYVELFKATIAGGMVGF
jgi:hypothetical protein